MLELEAAGNICEKNANPSDPAAGFSVPDQPIARYAAEVRSPPR
jgi:hypothetical protein